MQHNDGTLDNRCFSGIALLSGNFPDNRYILSVMILAIHRKCSGFLLGVFQERQRGRRVYEKKIGLQALLMTGRKKEVKIMTAKQFLEQIWKKDFEINLLQEDIDDLKSKMSSLCSPYLKEKVQVSSVNDRFAMFMVQIEKKEQEINEKINAYIDYREKAVSMINQLPDQEEAVVLYQWYIKRKTAKEIALQYNKSVSTVWTKYNNALASFEQVHAAVLE